jgi:pimeloyl-ACP methyl ester carboxylesterase
MTSINFIDFTFGATAQHLEYAWINRGLVTSPLVIFLHEGLGSLAMWRDYPNLLCEQGNYRGLVYSRAGYGKSGEYPIREKHEFDYMHREAREILPAILSTLEIENEKPILFGHSDGASIALIYATMFPDKISGVIALAPHIFVEDKALRGIEAAGEFYRVSDMKSRLRRYHDNPDMVFYRWHDAWLSTPFRDWNIEQLIPSIHCPILAIQGYDDEYATMEQIDGIKRLAMQTELLKLENCGHSPHKDQPENVSSAAIKFIDSVRASKGNSA